MPGVQLTNAPAAARDVLETVHPAEYLDRIEAAVAAGGGQLDPDTTVSSGSWRALTGAIGAVGAATAAAMESGTAFAAVRPPGHHALSAHAMGFCLVGNAVVAARRMQAAGRERVLIIDWDVHHGNGTQALIEADPAVRYVSLHQWPWYPGTGAAEERGVGNVFNVPRPPGLPPRRYVEDLWEAIESATDRWTPEGIVISAGFDAMQGDPLAGFTLEPEHFAELTSRLRERFAGVPIASLLEGGYRPERLADGVAAHLMAMG